MFFLVFNSWKVFIFLNIQNLNGKLGVDFMIRKLFSWELVWWKLILWHSALFERFAHSMDNASERLVQECMCSLYKAFMQVPWRFTNIVTSTITIVIAEYAKFSLKDSRLCFDWMRQSSSHISLWQMWRKSRQTPIFIAVHYEGYTSLEVKGQ